MGETKGFFVEDGKREQSLEEIPNTENWQIQF